MPARVKCALLAWHTLEDMLENNNTSGTEREFDIIILSIPILNTKFISLDFLSRLISNTKIR